MNTLQPFTEDFQRSINNAAVMVYSHKDSKVKKCSVLDAENNEVPGGGDFNRKSVYKELKDTPTIEVFAPDQFLIKAKTKSENITDIFVASPTNPAANEHNNMPIEGDTPPNKIRESVISKKKGPDQISKIKLNSNIIPEYILENLLEDMCIPNKNESGWNIFSQANDCEDLVIWYDCNDGTDEIEEAKLTPFFQARENFPILRKNKKPDLPEPMDGTPLPIKEGTSKSKVPKTPPPVEETQSSIVGTVRSILERILPFGAAAPDPHEHPDDVHDNLHSMRPKWDNQMEFLMSCIATSVGLGNVWRFPFVCFENGGGAFLIPYCIVLVLIGNSMYYLETALGQFSSSNNVRLWALSPAMRGTGYAQALGASYVLSYYVSIIALCIYYLFASFATTLPWSVCQEDWENCVPSVLPENYVAPTGGNSTGSAEYYFKRNVLRQSDGIHGGIGLPLWDLSLCLLTSWVTIFLIVVRGVKSSGKAAWFLALFPYVIMFILLIRAVTLPGADKGIIFFINPVWNKLGELSVWYAAVTQVFFSLSVCSGALIMFASYNGFRTNVFRYSMIVSGLDTFTSLISGVTIFGVLGNLAHVMKFDNVQDVIGAGGTSLAFISYPDAIAKTPFAPQLFAVLFFLMMVVLGVGSGVALLSTINTVIHDSFPKVKVLYLSLANCTLFFLLGLVYVTPGGQYILELVDYFGGTFMRLFAAITESIGVFWIYGLENICLDIEFMLERRPGPYWRVCWAVVTPILMIIVFIYAVVTRTALRFGQTYVYPNAAYFAGNFMQYSGMAMIPIFMFYALWKYRGKTCKEDTIHVEVPIGEVSDIQTAEAKDVPTVDVSEPEPEPTTNTANGETHFEGQPPENEELKAVPTINVTDQSEKVPKFTSDAPEATAVAGTAFIKNGWSKDGQDKKEFEAQGDTAPPYDASKVSETNKDDDDPEDRNKDRPKWDNQMEFLMSCIATSVGLGNVWRFPFTAYENGGGAFLVCYIIVLIFIGKPMYYLETVLGQFSNSNCVKTWALSPALKGTGYAQAMGAGYVLSYYVSIIALCFYYLAMSFQSTLPWGVCQEDWDNCVPSILPDDFVPGSAGENATSSAEYYFTKVVLQQSDGIHDGIGAPIWELTLCLFASWVIIFLIVIRGVKSSGKAAYFLAIFPYFVMFILLIRAVTLPGAGRGIAFFVNPEWSRILEIRVWYAAVTQVFFSLSVCSGALIMFASYNGFKTNVYKYSMIVTTLDTFTSLISGITIFGVLGNLAYEMGYDDVSQVVGSGGASLAFVSYPDAIAKTPFVPQLFSVLFFMMMAVLGIGSGVALLSTINTVLLDSFPRVPVSVMACGSCIAFFLIGLVYVTPGGQYILELVDYYGGTFMRLFAAITETIGVFWIYGLENICVDIEFMLGIKSSFYWRICWTIITPVIMIVVFMYALITTEALVFGGDYTYPSEAYIAGNTLQYAGMAMIPIFMVITFWKYRSSSCVETVRRSFRKKPTYGPSDRETRKEWQQFKAEAKQMRKIQSKNWFHHAFLSLYGGYKH